MKLPSLPRPVRDVVVHVVLVFAGAFAAQIVGASLGHFDWPTVSALLASAAAAGISAAAHYLTGLIPAGLSVSPSSPPSKPATPKKSPSKR